MNKTTEALKLAEEALEELHYSSGTVKAVTLYKSALAAIREALAEQDHVANTGKPIAEPYACEAGECPDKSLCAGACECLFKAEPVKQEPVMDYEYICALREGEQHQAEDSYFFVRPENDTPTSRKMFCQGFERGFHKGLKYAAPVSAKREWVELTDYEIVRMYAESPMCDSEMIAFARAVIAAFKEKNT